MRERPFTQVDVFTSTLTYGNPLAVVLDGRDLSDEQMQRFACWTNLSETTFLLPPSPVGQAGGAHYRLRIFTPVQELPFAGHPTLGSAHAWLQTQHAGLNELVQECAQGLVRLRRQSTGHWAFAAPALQRRDVAPDTLHDLCLALGVSQQNVRASQWLDNGPLWLGLLLDDAVELNAISPDHARLKQLGIKVGLAQITAQINPGGCDLLIKRANREARSFALPVPESSLQVRAFAAAVGVDEDPVTGSLNASLAQWLMALKHMPVRYTATQGAVLGRLGLVHLEQDATGQVWVGGDCVTGLVLEELKR